MECEFSDTKPRVLGFQGLPAFLESWARTMAKLPFSKQLEKTEVDSVFTLRWRRIKLTLENLDTLKDLKNRGTWNVYGHL